MIKKEETILITGCGGMLGEAVYQQFKGRCRVYATDTDLNEPWLERLDVTIFKDVIKYCNQIKPDYIIHLAALTDMEYCEIHPNEAYAVNAGGVENLAHYAREHDLPFVYISTAGIFDGKKDEYHEYNEPNPLSVYGKSKYAGEMLARQLPKSIIIRAGWMMGGGPKKDKKFINKIIKKIRTGASEIAVVDDKYGTPCYTYDLAKIIEALLDGDLYGLYHGVCDGGASRHEIASHLLFKLGKHQEVKLLPVDSSYYNESYFAPRPASEKLVNLKLKQVGLNITRDWRECLSEYIDKFQWHLWDLNTSGMDRNFFKSYFEIEKNHWLMKVRRFIVRDVLQTFGEPNGKRLLDFGCGSGYFVGQLASTGYDAHGVDISAEAVKHGQLQEVANLGVLDSHRIGYPDNHFDCILALDVLEHLEDESWAIKEIERVLTPGGSIIIMAPAFKFLWGMQDEVSHHYRRYNLSQLTDIFKKFSDLKVSRKTYFNTFLFPAITAVRLISRWFSLRGRESDFQINNKFLNKLFYSIFNLERKILRSINFPFGVSILMVLKKRNDYY